MNKQDTHLEISEIETKKQSGQRELYEPATITTVDEIVNEINNRSFYFLVYANFMTATSRFSGQVLPKIIKHDHFTLAIRNWPNQ